MGMEVHSLCHNCNNIIEANQGDGSVIDDKLSITEPSPWFVSCF